MPIRINLLAEQQSAEEARRRDPVKLAVWGAGFVASLVVLWALVLQVKIFSVKSSMKAEEAALKKLEKDAGAVAANLKRSAEVERRLAALQSLATNRFLWGPTLNTLQNVMAEKIQMTRFRVDQGYSVVAGRLSEKERERNPKAKAPEVAVERILVTIDAKDFANPADLNYNKFISEVGTAPEFQRLLEKSDGITLKGRQPSQPDPTDSRRHFMLFSIECKYPEKQRTL